MNNLDNFKAFFLFPYFWCQTYHICPRFRNQSGPAKIRTGSEALGPTRDDWPQKFLLNRLLKYPVVEVRAPDPVFGQNQILVPEETQWFSSFFFSRKNADFCQPSYSHIKLVFSLPVSGSKALQERCRDSGDDEPGDRLPEQWHQRLWEDPEGQQADHHGGHLHQRTHWRSTQEY